MSLNAPQQKTISQDERTVIALNRAAELKERISDYLEEKETIKTGFDLENIILENKKRILNIFNATWKDWQNWRWQLSNRIHDVATLSKIFCINKETSLNIKKVGLKYRWSISPYYASLFYERNTTDPIWKQAVPSIDELVETGQSDPMAEEYTSPAPCITRRYPDRLIINITNQCAMYCRHCQRRRNIGEVDRHKPNSAIRKALQYIRENREIRDVLITGGDALLLSDSYLDWLLTELDRIKHVEIKRIGTRTPVTMPQRITRELCSILKKHPPLYINTQFNHPREITRDAALACEMLVNAGVVLGNQAVLLKGINNTPSIMKKLNHELLKIRVRPYYIFHAKQVKGTGHFITSVDDGIKIMEKLRGYTSGLAVPSYIINTPNGYGKTPVLPQYILDRDEECISLRTWEHRVIKYPNGPHRDA
ncbi:MAG TPA: glutamate 2,3-aminomutase [Bacillota bacterium]|jgi:lysine 2,3-aminomutase|nr:glutamate 2,3-aminomutase [Peptococcaceae bacterium MAG4]NLW38729.1 glutamate 2,3-aminomutase [Peptococcaceae bacterium]HPZ43126.1 glutamate 2,3-aminomutase [Bacillota bacterium]HQD75240.1 glutamate 2,3-aminomutase [Bacillota bacterium]HUM58054.1 glutamate 2,3-aminomutase [Bacillota bacterium]